MKNQIHLYAVVRVDLESLGTGKPDAGITVKEVVWSQAKAEAEVERLQEINKNKGCIYFWQTTRMRTEGAADARDSSG